MPFQQLVHANAMDALRGRLEWLDRIAETLADKDQT
jgi:hypothetical protein